jgi:hypothetical protein
MLIGYQSIYAQAGMRFEELSKRLEQYFAQPLLNDIKSQLPQGVDYRVWGWDVGDFSGDSYNDLALSVKLSGDKSKRNFVFLFVDLDGYLTKVAEMPFDYMEMPLEIGVVIRYGICNVTKKLQQFNWIIRGFRFDNGVLVQQDNFETEKIGKYTHEKTIDYQTLRNKERYIVTNNSTTVYSTDHLIIPSYYRSRLIYKGYQDRTFCNYIDYVKEGAYYWYGDDDCSFSVSSAYDDKYLYFTVEVNDDNVVVPRCDTCCGDNIEIWFDISSEAKKGGRFVERKGDNLKFRKKVEAGIISFSIYPGDFKTKRAYIRDISTTDNLYNFQKSEVANVKVVSSIKEKGYILKLKIPFRLLGYKAPSPENQEITELGCTFIVRDIDNSFRPEEETIIATSLFDKKDPSTYGSLMIIPTNQCFGFANNVYKEDIYKILSEFGF